MITGEHRSWRSLWRVDLEACTATHDSGLVVTARRCAKGDGYEFTASSVEDWQVFLLASMPLPAVTALAQDLMCQAVTLYLQALRTKH